MNALRSSTGLRPYQATALRYTVFSLRLHYFCGTAPVVKHDEGVVGEVEIRGVSGRRYFIEKILQDKHMPFGRVYRARCDATSYVLKEIPQNYKIRTSIYERVRDCPHIRLPVDSVPDRRTKSILKQALQALAALHERDVVHNDVKPNNIPFNVKSTETSLAVDQVQLIDLEDAAHVGPDEELSSAQLGNWMWRSPESHAEGPIEKPSDMFSFGIVCIYAVTKKVIFDVGDSDLQGGRIDRLAIVLERQLSSFGSTDGLSGLLRYLGEHHAWRGIFQVIEDGLVKDDPPRKPFASWHGEGLDQDFKGLISGLTNLDPTRRLTAQETLRHKWFEGV